MPRPTGTAPGPSPARRLGDADYRRLKLATRRQIAACGGLEAAAAGTRVGKSELGNYQSLHRPGRYIPIDIAADLTACSRALDIAEALAAIAGAGVVPVAAAPGELKGEIIEFAEHAAATFRDYALLDRTARPGRELLERLDGDLQKVIRVAMQARENVKHRMAPAAGAVARPARR